MLPLDILPAARPAGGRAAMIDMDEWAARLIF
jgi:hypothetical protein